MKDKKYYISVGEPWGFESPDGENIIKGKIQTIFSDSCLVFKANHILKFDGIEGNILVLSPRHEGYDFSNLSNESIKINGSVLLKEYDIKQKENEFKNNSKFVIVGSLKSE